MRYFLLLFITFLLAFRSDKQKTASLINISSIKYVEISNSYTGKKWHLSSQALDQFKKILINSTITKNQVVVKPGHLNMTIIFENKLKLGVYMYPNGIYNDPQIYATKDNFPFSIELSKSINWDKLK